MSDEVSESRKAFHELQELIKEVDERFLGPEWGLQTPQEVADGLRAVMHILQGGLFSHFEESPRHPLFQRIVSPSRKFTGDNADAVYYDTAIDPSQQYRIRGNAAGAVYISLTLEAGADSGQFGSHTSGVLNDLDFDIAEDGEFEIWLGGTARERNWLELPPEATRVTTRHYYENEQPAACDPKIAVRLEITNLAADAPPSPPSDSSIAAGIRRVSNFLRSRTLELSRPGESEQPPFVSTTPNEFPEPIKPGNFSLAAADAAYSMAPYLLGAEDALVIRGRWPECRSANISLWNRHMQTLDFANRPVSLNRKQTRLEPDGSFQMILAHRDPGLPNWLDTEGRAFGLIFWRFMLPEGPIEKPEAKLIPFASLKAMAEEIPAASAT